MTSPASSSSQPVVFSTETQFPLPSQKFMIPTSWKRYQLSQLVNKALDLPKPVPFDFLVKGEVLRASLGEWCAEHGVGEEETLEIEYIQSVMPPQKMSDIPHEDWVSSISCKLEGCFLTASYDGQIRAFDYSKKLLSSHASHAAPITSLAIVPSSLTVDTDSKTVLVASASQDLTAQLTQITLSFSPSRPSSTKALASLHLHTGPVSSVAASPSGKNLITASWDSLIGLWDTSIPSADEIHDSALEGQMGERERKKRRKIDESGRNGNEGSRPKRKAPLMVLKSHIGRVSAVRFGTEAGEGETKAYSCGFDSTVRIWDVENGICLHTISASEKPFLSLSLTQSSPASTLLATSTDRTMTLYDIRLPTPSTSPVTFLHPSTPSTVSTTSKNVHQIVTGAYDGVVRVWDVRSSKGAMASFKAWEGKKKVLSVDWERGMVGVGGEGGLEVWQVGEEKNA